MIEIPDEFRNTVLKTRSISTDEAVTLSAILENEFNHVKLDYLYEIAGKGISSKINMHLMMIFDTDEDTLAFKLKYGNKYV